MANKEWRIIDYMLNQLAMDRKVVAEMCKDLDISWDNDGNYETGIDICYDASA